MKHYYNKVLGLLKQ